MANIFMLKDDLIKELMDEQAEYTVYVEGMIAGIETFIEKLVEKCKNEEAAQTPPPVPTAEGIEVEAACGLKAVEDGGIPNCC